MRAVFCAGLAALISGCATPYLEVDDAVAFEDGRTRFAAFTQKDSGPFFGGFEGVEVKFLVDGDEVATAHSDERGVALALGDVGPRADRFEARAHYGGKSLERAGKVLRWRRDAVVIACDIDATISLTALDALFFDETDEKSRPIEGAAEVLQELARDFGLVYFTARPKFTLDKTQRWLASHGFPEAPVLTSLTVGDLIAQARYKRRELAAVRELFPNLLIGIGNSHADSEGYGANGMLALIVNRTKDTRYGPHEIEFETWRQIRGFFRANRDLLRDSDRLRAAVRGEQMMVVPTLRYSGPGIGE